MLVLMAAISDRLQMPDARRRVESAAVAGQCENRVSAAAAGKLKNKIHRLLHYLAKQGTNQRDIRMP
jgi:hypothetical protein